MALERFRSDVQTLAVRHQRQIRLRDFRNEAQAGAPIRLLGAEIGFQSFVLEALDTPEEIKLITGHADAERVLAGNRLFARGGQIGGNALVGGLARGGNPGHQIRALYLVQAAGTLDVQRGDAQIPVVVQSKLNEPLQVLIGEERLPSDFRSQLIGGLGEDRALGHEVVGPGLRHRGLRADVVRGHRAAGQQHRQRERHILC